MQLLPPGSNFWLNPQSECQKPLPGDEIALLLSGKIFAMDLTARGAASLGYSRASFMQRTPFRLRPLASPLAILIGDHGRNDDAALDDLLVVRIDVEEREA